jgi:hypothetical protein
MVARASSQNCVSRIEECVNGFHLMSKERRINLEQVMIRLCENIDCCALFSISTGRLTYYRYLWSVTMQEYYVCDVVVT